MTRKTKVLVVRNACVAIALWWGVSVLVVLAAS
jgi:hypothetical protein